MGYSQWMDYLDEQALNDAELHSDDAHLLFQAARVEIERGNYVEALALLERCSHLLPDALTPSQWQAYAFAELQRWPDAIDAATRFIYATDDVELRLQRAAWCLEVGLPHQAIEDAKAVIENNHFLTRRAQAIKLLAYRQLGDFDAIPTLQAEIEKNRPHDRRYAEAVDAMTTAEISLRHSRLAEVYAEQLLESNNPEYRVPLAWMNIRRGDFETALALIEHSDAQPSVPDDSPDFADSVDVCQSVLGGFLLRLSAGDYVLQSEDQLRARLLTIAKKKFSMLQRQEIASKRARRRTWSLEDVPEIPNVVSQPAESNLELAELSSSVRMCLTDNEWQLLQLRKQGLSWNEIENQLHVGAVVLKKRLSRSLRRVSIQLGLDYWGFVSFIHYGRGDMYRSSLNGNTAASVTLLSFVDVDTN